MKKVSNILRTQLTWSWRVLRESMTKFSENDVFTHAAALSYYTIFSLPPMLLIILYTTTYFYDEASVKEVLFGQIGDLVGQDGARQLLQTINKLNIFEPTWWATALSLGLLAFTATTVFTTLQGTLNRIFGVKAKVSGLGIFKMVKDRLISFAMLIGIAFILLVSLVVNALVESFSNYLSLYFGSASQIFNWSINLILPFFVIVFLFAMMFKFLPDLRLRWRDTWTGAIITSILFILGKYLISFYIGNSEVAGLYDAAGSIMVIMLWVFYASIIVMYGAVLTAVNVQIKGNQVQAKKYAVRVAYHEVEKPSIKSSLE